MTVIRWLADRAVYVLVALLAAGTLWAAVDESSDADRIRELEGAVRDSSQVVDNLRRELDNIDARADTVIRVQRETVERVDTVQATLRDSILGLLSRQHAHLVDSLEAQDRREDAAYEQIILQQARQIEARDTLIRALESEVRANEALARELRDQLHPGPFERIFGGVGEGAARVAVVGLAVATDHWEAAAGAGAMWAVEAALP